MWSTGQIDLWQLTLALTLSAISLAGCGEKAQESQSGRYRIYQSANSTILLDTKTGKSWAKVYAEDRENEPDFWEPMARQDIPEEWQAFERLHAMKKAEK